MWQAIGSRESLKTTILFVEKQQSAFLCTNPKVLSFIFINAAHRVADIIKLVFLMDSIYPDERSIIAAPYISFSIFSKTLQVCKPAVEYGKLICIPVE